jgi:hypothetical protein
MRAAIGLPITPDPLNEASNAVLATDPGKGKPILHPNGGRRITGVEILVSKIFTLHPQLPVCVGRSTAGVIRQSFQTPCRNMMKCWYLLAATSEYFASR